MTPVVIVLTTVPPEFGVAAMASALVAGGHAACVSVLPVMESTYRWQGAIETAAERQVIIKTTEDRVDALKAALAALHPYEVPELLVLPVTGGGEAYLQWIGGS